MKLPTHDIKVLLQDSLSWIIPVGIIIVTFIVLFFGISEQVGNLRVYNRELANQVLGIRNELNSLKGDTPANPEKGKEAVILQTTTDVSAVSADFETIKLNGKTYWTYAFNSSEPLVLEAPVVIKAGDEDVAIYRYKKDSTSSQKTTSPFELIEYNQADKKVKLGEHTAHQVVVFVQDSMVIFQDFEPKQGTDIKLVLKSIAENTSVPSEVRDAATKEISKQ